MSIPLPLRRNPTFVVGIRCYPFTSLEHTPMRTSSEPSVTLCSVVSEQSGEDPAGSAWAIDRYFLIEVPLPWPYNMLESRKMPPGITALVQRLFEERIYWGWIGIAPDPEYSIDGMTRVVDCRLPDNPPFHQYQRTEYLFPTNRAGDLAEIMVRTPGDPALLPFRQETDLMLRDLLVCTHGTVDACCATYGYPMYRLLRHMAPGADTPVRVWRCTHFGGHRFAATLLDLPEGRYWGRLKPRDLAHLVRRDVPFSELRHAYRGWSALPSPMLQIAEAAAFLQAGWEWTRYAITPLTAPPDVERPADRQTVRFAWRDPRTGHTGTAEVVLEPTIVARTMEVSLSDDYVGIQQYEAARCLITLDGPDA
jgi:hypothetical protein